MNRFLALIVAVLRALFASSTPAPVGAKAPVAATKAHAPGFSMSQITMGVLRRTAERLFPNSQLLKVLNEHFRNLHDDILLGEEVAKAIAPFWPPAAYVKDALVVADFLTTYGKPIQPGDPNYNAPAGNADADHGSLNANI